MSDSHAETVTKTLTPRERQLANLKPWQPGVSANPGGRPKGARTKLQSDFFKALQEDFSAYGVSAIEEARAGDPLGYVKVVASLMPKEFTIAQPLAELTDEQLDAALITARALLNAANSGIGEGGEGQTQPPEVLQAIPETT